MPDSDAAPFPVFDRDVAAARLAWLAERGVYIGTSSWKYPGWLGRLYEPGRYLTRGKVSQAKFERECLREHAEVFHTVCVDAGYYRFPSPEWIAGLMEQTPPGYNFTFKVTDDITARTFPNLPRHGEKAGQRNEHFLDAPLFQQTLIQTLTPWKDRLGVLIFEFSQFHARDFERGRDFVEALDQFFSLLPKGWNYGVEIRNKGFLHAEYFDMLRSHGVAHVFNQWTRMPDVGDQMNLPGSTDTADFLAARFLLRQGRTYEQAVEKFSPYEAIKEPFPEARDAAERLVQLVLKSPSPNAEGKKKKAFIYINNRLEGNSLETIFAILMRHSLYPEGLPLLLPTPPPKAPPPGNLL